mmetsp:Transcript_8481/g.12529  ORF Transcript_8481/g.12529 Transcript_8481/m.12529 type:complete len:218 (+) Transcript_8481:611-1264(+)
MWFLICNSKKSLLSWNLILLSIEDLMFFPLPMFSWSCTIILSFLFMLESVLVFSCWISLNCFLTLGGTAERGLSPEDLGSSLSSSCFFHIITSAWRFLISKEFKAFCSSSSSSPLRSWILSWKFSKISVCSLFISKSSCALPQVQTHSFSEVLFATTACPLPLWSWFFKTSISFLRSEMMLLYSAMWIETIFLLGCTLYLMFLARLEYLSVLIVSSN